MVRCATLGFVVRRRWRLVNAPGPGLVPAWSDFSLFGVVGAAARHEDDQDGEEDRDEEECRADAQPHGHELLDVRHGLHGGILAGDREQDRVCVGYETISPLLTEVRWRGWRPVASTNLNRFIFRELRSCAPFAARPLIRFLASILSAPWFAVTP
jgi:hypothetical protein